MVFSYRFKAKYCAAANAAFQTSASSYVVEPR